MHWAQKYRIRRWLLAQGFVVGYLDLEGGRTADEFIGNMFDSKAPRYEATDTKLLCYWPGILSHVDID